ncbi:unnamed protein product [Symbiodinium sp. CCMP2592]|nr:unnamed protein product [Symbiodinium sp. CCMP2592]
MQPSSCPHAAHEEGVANHRFDPHNLEDCKSFTFENCLQLIVAGSIDPAETDTQVAVDPPASSSIRGKGLGTRAAETKALQPAKALFEEPKTQTTQAFQPAAAEQSKAPPGQPKTQTTEALQPAAPAEQSKALFEEPKTQTTQALQPASAEQSKALFEEPKTQTTQALQPAAPAEQSKAVPEEPKTQTTKALQPAEALPEKPKTQTTETSQPGASLPLDGQPEHTHGHDDGSESSRSLNLFDAKACWAELSIQEILRRRDQRDFEEPEEPEEQDEPRGGSRGSAAENDAPGTKTFAKRSCPPKPGPGLEKWVALKEVFESQLAPKFRFPTKYEDCYSNLGFEA